MGGYRYNAGDDQMVAWNRNFTSRIGDGSGDPEEEYLATLRFVAACKPRSELLDIGCGLGRVVDVMRHDVASIVGLEPDADRFGTCHASFHDGGRIQIHHCTSADYRAAHPGRRFDIVVVSMVIQHVPTRTCDLILADVPELLADDGIGVIATTQQDAERFTFQSDQTPRSREAFDRYASDSSDQTHGIPVRQFSKASFLAALDRAGLDMVRWGQFSYLRPEKLGWFAKWMGSTTDAIKDVATSQYAVVRRRR
jgi:protein-L-isoaspartate O-methyltransferase